MTLRLLSIDQVLDKVPVSRQQIYALVAKREFPKQKRIGKNRVAWLESEVDTWIKERVLESETL